MDGKKPMFKENESWEEELQQLGEGYSSIAKKFGEAIKERKIRLLLDFVIDVLHAKYVLVSSLGEEVLFLIQKGRTDAMLYELLSLLNVWKNSMVNDLNIIQHSVNELITLFNEFHSLLSAADFIIPEPQLEAMDKLFANMDDFILEARKRLGLMFQQETVNVRKRDGKTKEIPVPQLVIRPTIVEHAFSPIRSLIAALEKLMDKIDEFLSFLESKQKNGNRISPRQYWDFSQDVGQINPEEVNKNMPKIFLRKLRAKE